jgi:hypothetical protein
MMHRHDFPRPLPFMARAAIITGLTLALWAAIGLAVWGVL